MKLKASLFIILIPLAFGPGTAAAGVETGAKAPDFTLTDTNGTAHSLSDFEGNYVVLEWLNHNCPFVKKHYGAGNMQALQKRWRDKGIVWLSINSSHPDHRDYKTVTVANKLTEDAKAAPTAVLMDEDGNVGKMYGAKTTPHIFIIDPSGELIYQGAIDSISSANPKDIAKADNYVNQVLTASRAGESIPVTDTRPYGCSVKY